MSYMQMIKGNIYRIRYDIIPYMSLMKICDGGKAQRLTSEVSSSTGWLTA